MNSGQIPSGFGIVRWKSIDLAKPLDLVHEFPPAEPFYLGMKGSKPVLENELSVFAYYEKKAGGRLSKDLPPYCALALTGVGMQRRRNLYFMRINLG